MKANVIVTLKPTVLDPQGMTIQRNLESAGLADVTDIRQGKVFDVRLKDGVAAEKGREIVERLAKEVLTNPVIEQYRIVWQAYQIERMTADIQELKTKIATDAQQDMKLAVIESRIEALPTTMDMLKLLGQLGLIGVAGKGGHVLYKKRKET